MYKQTANKIINEVRQNTLELTSIKPEVLAKLEDAMRKDFNFTGAALYAGISRMTLWRYFDAYPEFKGYLKGLRCTREFLAQQIINDRLAAGDLKTAKWVLERRDPRYCKRRKQRHPPITCRLIISD
jgi:hypothetical protein